MGYCCGRRDCKDAQVTIMQFGEMSTLVLIDTIILDLPNTSVKESQDGHTYWCAMRADGKLTKENTRCVFYTIGS